jgi:hypothetical protein
VEGLTALPDKGRGLTAQDRRGKLSWSCPPRCTCIPAPSSQELYHNEETEKENFETHENLQGDSDNLVLTIQISFSGFPSLLHCLLSNATALQAGMNSFSHT